MWAGRTHPPERPTAYFTTPSNAAPSPTTSSTSAQKATAPKKEEAPAAEPAAAPAAAAAPAPAAKPAKKVRPACDLLWVSPHES